MKLVNGRRIGRLSSPELGTVLALRKDGTVQSALVKATDAKTLSQGYQRLKMPNLGSFYKQSKVALEKAFEGSNLSIFAELVRYNATSDMLPVGITKQEKAVGGCVAMPYIITEGELAPINFTSPTLTDLKLSGLSVINDSTTVGQFADAVVAANPGKYQYDDKIVFIGAVQYVENGTPMIAACYDAITLVKDSEQLLKDLVDIKHFIGGQKLSIVNFIGCYAFVHTRIDAQTGALLLSKQQLFNNNEVYVNTYTDPEHLRAAALSYKFNPDEAAVLEPTTAESRRIMAAFGYSDRIGQSGSAAVANGIAYAKFGDTVVTPGSNGPVLNSEVSNKVVITMRNADSLGDITAKINGASVSTPAQAGAEVSLLVPAGQVGQKLVSVDIIAENGSFSATFQASMRG